MIVKRKIARLTILEYALTGAITDRGVGSGYLTEDEMETLRKDIAEIERRIVIIKIANERKEKAK